jgi:hypothetical protein
MQTVPGKRTTFLFLTASLMLSSCGGGGGGGTVPTTRPAPIEIVQTIETTGPGKQVSYLWRNGGFSDIGSTENAAASATFMFDANDKLALLTIQTTTATSATKIDFVGSDIDDLGPDFWVAANPASKAVISNPLSSAWHFQSFGVWESGLNADGGYYGAMSVGTPSPAGAIPSAYGATFNGKVVGSHVTDGIGHAMLANLTVEFDSGGRSLTFTTSNTTDTVTGLSTPGLDLTSQTLTYESGVFSGELTTDSGLLTGPSIGQFYGPNAEELGGVFFLRSAPDKPVETYSGAYGASR